MPTTQFVDGAPAKNHATITPSDTADLPALTRSIRVGGAGNVSIVVDGVTVVYTCVAGEILPLVASRVNATGTTATGLVAWW